MDLTHSESVAGLTFSTTDSISDTKLKIHQMSQIWKTLDINHWQALNDKTLMFSDKTGCYLIYISLVFD